jgi:hypothetical protein
MNCLLPNIIFQNMEDSTYFYCEIPGCLDNFSGPCETCCKKCFCKEHLESHCQISSLTCQGSLDDLNFSQTQSSVIPEESASGLHSVANVPATLYAQHGTKVMMQQVITWSPQSLAFHFFAEELENLQS